jgi:hypothetical protein
MELLIKLTYHDYLFRKANPKMEEGAADSCA